MDGGIYSLFSEEKELYFNEEKFKFKNNSVDNYINNIGSKPSFINLKTKINSYNITTGDYFPLSFILYDRFDAILEDFSKYYSFMTLKVNLEEDDEEGEEEDKNKILN